MICKSEQDYFGRQVVDSGRAEGEGTSCAWRAGLTDEGDEPPG